MSRQGAELRRAVRFRVLARYGGQLCAVLAAIVAVPSLVAAVLGSSAFAWRGLGAAAALALAALGARVGAPRRLQLNEGLVLAAGAFALGALGMWWPMTTEGVAAIDALFESVSGVTTTGLSTLESIERRSPSFLFARAWLQWCGGLGVVVLSLALVADSDLVAGSMVQKSPLEEDLAGSVRAHARRSLIVYLCLTAAAWLACQVAGLAPFDALLHAFTSVSTAGFAPRDDSLHSRPGAVQVVVLVCCAGGALPMLLWHRWWLAWRRHPVGSTSGARTQNVQLAAFALCYVLLAAAVAAAMAFDGGLDAGVAHHAPLLALSAQTTAGFSTMDPEDLGPTSQLLLAVAMFVGGPTGSTVGGIKILRLLLILSVVRLLLVRSALPRSAVVSARLGGLKLPEDEIGRALLVAAGMAVTALLCWLPFVAGGHPAIPALFDVVSAVGTVGLSAGVADAALDPELKLLLCAAMLLGRVEVFAWLVVLFPGTWIGRRVETP